MKLEEQVCTLEQAKKLKELLKHGQWKNIDFNFYWMATDSNLDYFLTTNARVGGYAYPRDIVECFTVGELGVMLPHTLNLNDGHQWSWYHRNCWKGHSFGYSAYGQKSHEQEWFKNEAEARAAMLIYLLENKLTTPEEVNQRLSKQK